MPKLAYVAAVLCFAAGVTAPARADDDPKDIIVKAIKAQGGEEKLSKRAAFRTKSKGSIDIGDMKVPFTNEMSIKVPEQLKSTVTLTIQGQDITVVQVYNAGKGWVSANGNQAELQDKLLDELKEGAHATKVENLVPLLKEKEFTLTALGETMVNDKPAVGVRVSSEGHRDIELYFDKETGQLLKRGRNSIDSTTMKDVFQEAYFTGFRDFDGVKLPTHIVLHNDGKKFLEMDITDFEPVEKFNDDEFAKP